MLKGLVRKHTHTHHTHARMLTHRRLKGLSLPQWTALRGQSRTGICHVALALQCLPYETAHPARLKLLQTPRKQGRLLSGDALATADRMRSGESRTTEMSSQ